jgi:hypothetical protein
MTPWLRTGNTFGWLWTPWTYRFAHGGWIYLHPGHPIATLRWFWRFRGGVPHSIMRVGEEQ